MSRAAAAPAIRLTRKQIAAIQGIHRGVFNGSPLMALEIRATDTPTVEVTAYDNDPRGERHGGVWMVDDNGGGARIR